MKLSDFIRGHTDEIVQEWERFARTCEPAASQLDDDRLRDHVLQLVAFVANDIESMQTDSEQAEKGEGRAPRAAAGDSEAETHAVVRVADGFTIDQVVGEFRALRASVLRLRAKESTPIAGAEVEELTRFNECVDQLLSESVSRHTRLVADVLRDTNRQKDEFISTLSHELRNPLSTISSCVQILSDDGSKYTNERVIKMLARQTAMLQRLLEDLLDVARISRHRVILKIEPTDVRTCVQDAVDANTQLIEQKAHVVNVDLPGTPLMIQSDCARIAQVVSNLLNNAAKYSPRSSTIEVALKRQTPHVIIRVRDNGIGIDENLIPHVFDAFYSSRAGDLAKQGLGVGLWLSRQLTELLGGTLTVNSKGPGKGAEFCVMLPLPTP